MPNGISNFTSLRYFEREAHEFAVRAVEEEKQLLEAELARVRISIRTC